MLATYDRVAGLLSQYSAVWGSGPAGERGEARSAVESQLPEAGLARAAAQSYKWCRPARFPGSVPAFARTLEADREDSWVLDWTA